jgi:hypothetical protein
MLEKVKSFVSNGAHITWRTGSLVIRDPQSTFLIARMAGWVAFVTLCLKFMPLPRVLDLVTPRQRRISKDSASETSEKLARQLDQLLGFNVFCFTPTCWKRAAVLYRYLALNGIETRVVFGVRKETDAALAGHAWLEAKGIPILESSTPEYVVTFTFPQQLRAR